MNTLKEQKDKDIMDDLYNVGTTKMLGYLPLITVITNCDLDIPELKESLDNKGLFTHVFKSNECSIFSGAIFVADLERLQEFLLEPEQQQILQDAKWPNDAKLFINKVANVHAEDESDLYNLIAMTFNNPLLTEEQRLHAYPTKDSTKENAISNISKIRESHSLDSNAPKLK